MAKTESGKSSKTSERRSPKKKEGSPALQAKDEGSEESKFNPRMREAYLQKVVPALMKEFGYKNIMQVPKLERIGCDYGPEASDYKGEEGHRLFQVAPRDADRHKGHVA